MDLQVSAQAHLERLCVDISNRRVGSPGNQQAAEYFSEVVSKFSPEVHLQSFDCMDWRTEGASLLVDNNSFEVFSSPYSLGCEVSGLLTSAENLEELQNLETGDFILLLHGDLAREQFMPTRFPFFNPPEHQRVFQILSEKHPKAILAATSRNPDIAGGQYPFPLIEDGDFDIPSVFMTAEEGSRLLPLAGRLASLISQAERIPSNGCNVVARFNPAVQKKIVITAHIDAKAGSPGALDNAGGVVVLLVLAELLAGFHGGNAIELVALNGEDYYAAPGEVTFLEKNKGHLHDILVNINMDGVGYCEGGTEFSLYDCAQDLAVLAKEILTSPDGISEGKPWPQSDHMVFVQNKIPAIAFTSQLFPYLTSNITHTTKDRMELVDCNKLVFLAQSVFGLVKKLDEYFS